MKWYVTGCKGFIGSRFQELTGADGEDVDLNVTEDFPHGSTIVHLAAQAGIIPCEQSPGVAVADNIGYFQDVLYWASRRSNPIVFASSAAAENPSNVYGATKLLGEALVKEHGKRRKLPYWILRIGNVYGPGSEHKTSAIAQWCKAARDGKQIEVHGNGMQERGFIHVDDVCRAIIEVVNHPSGTYRVTGPMEHVGRVASMVSVKTNAPIVNTDPRMPEPEPVPMVPNWEPEILLNEGLDDTLAWFMERKQ